MNPLSVTKPEGRLQDRSASVLLIWFRGGWQSKSERLKTTAYIHHVVPSLFVQTILSPLRPDPSCQSCHSPPHLDGRHPRRLWVVDVQLPPCLPVCSSHWGLCSKADMTGAVPLGLILVAATAQAPNSNPVTSSFWWLHPVMSSITQP